VSVPGVPGVCLVWRQTCSAMLCCVFLCCAVLCCAVLCCPVLCRAALRITGESRSCVTLTAPPYECAECCRLMRSTS
jgi:hypothetical protein